MPFGAFARLEEGLDGLIHVSEMGDGGEMVKPRDVVVEGQQVQVRVLHVDSNKQRLGLSLIIDPLVSTNL
jgi:small subunit ribosomal protein S1